MLASTGAMVFHHESINGKHFLQVMFFRHEATIQTFLRVGDEVFGKRNVESFVITLYANNVHFFVTRMMQPTYVLERGTRSCLDTFCNRDFTNSLQYKNATSF